jgi:hypothetical protein
MSATPEVLNTKGCRAEGTFRTQRFRLVLTLFLACLLISSETDDCIANRASFTILPLQASENKSPTRPQLNAKPGSWYLFRGPDGDFTLQFPRKPDIQDISEGPITLIRYYGVTTDDGTTFSVNFQDIGGDPRASQNNEWSRDLEENMSIADRAQNRQIVQTHRVGKSIIEAEIWQTVVDTGARINFLRRSILYHSRIYTLGCGPVINNKKVDQPLCQRFFNSMRFITRPPNRTRLR